MSYKESIIKAIEELSDPTGSSSIAIKRHVKANLPKDKKWMIATFMAALKSGVASGDFIQVENSYKLAPEFKGRSAAALNVVETGRTSPESSEGTVTITKKRKQELEEGFENAKRYKSGVGAAVEEYLCPITTELPADPVTAEDGRVYERSAIEEHIRRKGDDLTSPMTREPMGPRLTFAVQARNSIRSLVESGVIDGELANQWKQKVKVEETRKKAGEGDAEAMCDLGQWYYLGKNGLAEDNEMAYQWFKKASDLHSVRGMAEAGCMLIIGRFVEKNVIHGMTLTAMAARMGSESAARRMGDCYRIGCHGLPKDKSQAKYWYRKVVDGNCSVKHAKELHRNRAAVYLHELEGN